MPPRGQPLVQFRHTMHSVARTVPCGSAAPWQSAPHTSQSLHLRGILADAEERELRQQAQQGAERAEHAAVEARVDEVEGQGAEEDDGDEGAPLEVALALVEAVGRVAGGRQERRREPAPRRGDGIEQPDLHAARRGQAEHHGQDDVLDLVRRPRGVLLHALEHLALAAQEPEHVVQDAHRAHPRAEEAAEDQREHDERQGPQPGCGAGRARRAPWSAPPAGRARGTTRRRSRGCSCDVVTKTRKRKKPRKMT